MDAPPRRPRSRGRPIDAPAPAHRVLTGAAVACGFFTVLMLAGDLGARGFLLGALLAVIPVPVYVALALWVDRFEPEPPKTLAQAFACGATVAVLLALCINVAAQSVATDWMGERAADVFAAVVGAPVVEELAKGMVLLFLFRELRDEFDDVVDGVVYAAMVGLGFAMMENVQYYGTAFNQGGSSSVVTFAIRGMMAPFAHPVFTAMFGMGLGYAREKAKSARKFWAPAAGLGAAMGLHALWNLATQRDAWFMALYFAVMVPVFLGILVIVYLSLAREGRVIREHLAQLVDDGVLGADQLDRLCVVRSRLRASWDAWRDGGLVHWRRRREMHRIASELAFHRWRVRRGLSQGVDADARRDAEYLRRLEAACRSLRL